MARGAAHSGGHPAFLRGRPAVESAGAEPLSQHTDVFQRTDVGARWTVVVGRHLAHAVLLLSLDRHITALRLLAVADVAREEGLCPDGRVDVAGSGACGTAAAHYR